MMLLRVKEREGEILTLESHEGEVSSRSYGDKDMQG